MSACGRGTSGCTAGIPWSRRPEDQELTERERVCVERAGEPGNELNAEEDLDQMSSLEARMESESHQSGGTGNVWLRWKKRMRG